MIVGGCERCGSTTCPWQDAEARNVLARAVGDVAERQASYFGIVKARADCRRRPAVKWTDVAAQRDALAFVLRATLEQLCSGDPLPDAICTCDVTTRDDGSRTSMVCTAQPWCVRTLICSALATHRVMTEKEAT